MDCFCSNCMEVVDPEISDWLDPLNNIEGQDTLCPMCGLKVETVSDYVAGIEHRLGDR